MPVQQLLTFNDLPGLQSSPSSVRTGFERHFGENPDGIALNSETYFDAVKPAITSRYGHPCYKTLGTITYDEGEVTAGSSVVLGSNYAINNSDQEATISLEVSGSWMSSNTVSSSVTAGMEFSAEFGIEGVFKLGSKFNLSVTAGQSHTTSQAMGQKASVSVKVPPKSKIKVTMVGTEKQEVVNFSAPITVSGMLGANFSSSITLPGHPDEGSHYFWFLSAPEVLTRIRGNLTGTVTHASAFDVQTEIGKTEPV